MMNRFFLPFAVALTAILTAGCFVSSKRDGSAAESREKAGKKGSEQVAWNAFGDPNWKSDIHGAIDRAREKTAGTSPGPRRNPDLNLPPVDPSLARGVTYSRVSGVPGPYVAMTFDDGPHPTLTPRLLDILRERNIRATFFVVAPNTKRYPHIIQRMIAEGHEVANHTVNHPTNMARLGQERVRSEFRGCEDAIVAAAGRRPVLMRPPGGSVSSAQKVWIHDEFGYKTILWSCDPEDWKRPGVSVVTRRIIDGATNGAIILAHDIHAPTIAAVPAAMDGILAKGFRFVTVSQLIAMEQQAPAIADAGPPSETSPMVPKVFSSIPFPQPLPFDSVPTTPAAFVEPETGGSLPEISLPEPAPNPG